MSSFLRMDVHGAKKGQIYDHFWAGKGQPKWHIPLIRRGVLVAARKTCFMHDVRPYLGPVAIFPFDSLARPLAVDAVGRLRAQGVGAVVVGQRGGQVVGSRDGGLQGVLVARSLHPGGRGRHDFRAHVRQRLMTCEAVLV